MGEYNAQKVLTADTDGFTETKEFEVLHQGNVEVNHNKFYCLELQFNPKTRQYRVFSHYGRLGKTSVYDVRGPMEEKDAKKEYDSILVKKKKGKKVKREDGSTEMEQYVKIDTVMPSVGSENIRKSAATVQIKSKSTTAHISSTAFTDSIVTKIINQIADENIHNITTNTTLTLTSNGFETPLGPVTKEHVAKSRDPLNTLKTFLSKGKLDPNSKPVIAANNLYFSLIPHKFSHKITQSDWILTDVKLMEEFDLLDQLETAVQMGTAMQNSSQQLNALGTEVLLLKDQREWDRIVRKFESSKAPNHHGTNVFRYKIKNIFSLRVPEERKRYEDNGKKLGNTIELFHGSQTCNILSILKNGLIIPPVNAGFVTGRMFGDGIYAAHNSTKALNYSIGFWSSKRNKYDNAFLFLTNFAMGKTHEVYHSLYSGAPKGFDSVHAKQSLGGLYNDEYIVYKLFQSSITHLCELTQ